MRTVFPKHFHDIASLAVIIVYFIPFHVFVLVCASVYSVTLYVYLFHCVCAVIRCAELNRETGFHFRCKKLYVCVCGCMCVWVGWVFGCVCLGVCAILILEKFLLGQNFATLDCSYKKTCANKKTALSSVKDFVKVKDVTQILTKRSPSKTLKFWPTFILVREWTKIKGVQ